MELTADEIAVAAGGAVIAGQADARASSYTIDSRLQQPGGCFIAVRGHRDGHDFVGDAAARGATIAVVQRPVEVTGTTIALVRVEESMEGVAGMARLARERLAAARVVGITGSAGKTATKDLTSAALGRTWRVHASAGSFNNEYGLPLTLLGADPATEVIVAEMGARFAGNIRELAALARPDIGVVTHVGLAHAEHLGGPEGIAGVKGELLEALPAAGLAVLNDDDDATPRLAERTSARVIRVGTTPRADVRVSEVALDDQLRPSFVLEMRSGVAKVALALRGEHQALNAAMAVTVAGELGVPLDRAVEAVADARPAPHRMELLTTSDGVVVLNDAYNSSPTSAVAALRALAALPVTGRRVAVLGEMLELGAHAARAHTVLGEHAGAAGVDLLVAVGSGGAAIADAARERGVEVVLVTDADAAASVVAEHVHAGDAVLVKASRAVGLERLVETLTRGRVAR